MTRDTITTAAAGETAIKKASEVEATAPRTAPESRAVEKKKEPAAHLMRVDAGKRLVEVLPGIKLVAYSKGYVCLKVKSTGWTRKVEVGKPLYRDDLMLLANALLAEAEGARSYDEAHRKEDR